MKDITIEVVEDGNIEQCRDLCNELMKFQKSKAVFLPQAFDGMDFETRLKVSFLRSPINQLVVAKDGETPIGYIFNSIENVAHGDKSEFPEWIPSEGRENMKGFYPDWDVLPDKVGCLNHLYFRPEYRGRGLGSKFFDLSMEWFESFPYVDVIFVYISNGNDAALDFYLKHGFLYSHDVFGGFIKAAYKYKK